MNSKPIGVVWFNGRTNIGIVMGYDAIEKRPKAWIKDVAGSNLEFDIQDIMAWGAKFPVREAHSLIIGFGTILDRNYWIEAFSVENKVDQGSPQDD